MKISTSFFALLFFTSFVLAPSCGDDDNDGVTQPGDGDCTASWKVDGTSFSEDNMTLCVYLDNTLNLSSSASGGDFQLQISPITATGTYTADPSNFDQTVYVQVRLEDGTSLVSSDVTIVVTELSDSKTKGTFSGSFFDLMDITQTNAYMVTDGKFEANF